MPSLDRLTPYAPAISRIALSIVFLWFGTNQVVDSGAWTSYLPDFVRTLPVAPAAFVFANGIFEVVFGIFLLVGLYVRITAFLLGAKLLGIAATLGLTAVGVRDFGLAFATLAVAAYGKDVLSADTFFARKEAGERVPQP